MRTFLLSSAFIININEPIYSYKHLPSSHQSDSISELLKANRTNSYNISGLVSADIFLEILSRSRKRCSPRLKLPHGSTPEKRQDLIEQKIKVIGLLVCRMPQIPGLYEEFMRNCWGIARVWRGTSDSDFELAFSTAVVCWIQRRSTGW